MMGTWNHSIRSVAKALAAAPPLGRLRDFVTEGKRAGLFAKVIEQNGVRGVSPAP